MNSTVANYFSEFESYQKMVDWLSGIAGFDTATLVMVVVISLMAFIVINAMMLVGGLGTYAERKISADLQARIGPNRVGPYGILQFLADGLKMTMKEDVTPAKADKVLFNLAPFLSLFGIFGTLAVLPISSGLALSHLNVGVFFLIAISSIVGIGIFLGGYASNSKWSMLGGMRGASQIVSYEIPVTLSVLSIVLLAGSLNFKVIVGGQTGMPTGWFIFHNPFSFMAFFVYSIAALAEANRAPFDLPEAESELVSGYHTEYTGMKFGIFALAEYIEVFVLASVAAAMFLGGYNVPFHLGGDGIIGQVLQLGAFVTKSLLIYYVVIWIRWTFPRLRADQLMVVCWKYLTPIAIFNLVGSAVWLYAFKGQSILQLVLHSGGSSAGGH
ncbi:MAG: NADH-quinone oxidoreductase subunit NuoH [Bacteriovoracaceae bacterium]|jgi:NADH-quinone oxidoreductase subunit H|nr:NADH-quinone oxidoreductase subunit NuoH [Bacteriovoracaceae bacterium]